MLLDDLLNEVADGAGSAAAAVDEGGVDDAFLDSLADETGYPHVLHGWGVGFGGDRNAPQRRLATFLRGRDVPHLDLLASPALRGVDPGSLFLDRNHFSPEGARRAAGAIAAFLASEALLQPPSGPGVSM